MSIIQYEKATGIHCEEYGLSPAFLSADFCMPCGSVFDNGYARYHAPVAHKGKSMVAVPKGSPLIDLEAISRAVSPSESGVSCKRFLRGDHEIVFFVDGTNPNNWYGFVAFKVDEDNTLISSSYSINHLLTYVRREHRGDQMGITLSGMAGFIISESLRYPRDGSIKALETFSLHVSGQGLHPRGKACLEAFANGCGYLLGDLEGGSYFGDEIVNVIQYAFEYVDEY